MIRSSLLAGLLGVFAACAGDADEPEKSTMTTQADFVQSEIQSGCEEAGEPSSLCACLAESLVTDIDPQVLALFHKIISDDGVEELNHGDWPDELPEALREKTEAHTQKVRASCGS